MDKSVAKTHRLASDGPTLLFSFFFDGLGLLLLVGGLGGPSEAVRRSLFSVPRSVVCSFPFFLSALSRFWGDRAAVASILDAVLRVSFLRDGLGEDLGRVASKTYTTRRT